MDNLLLSQHSYSFSPSTLNLLVFLKCGQKLNTNKLAQRKLYFVLLGLTGVSETGLNTIEIMGAKWAEQTKLKN